MFWIGIFLISGGLIWIHPGLYVTLVGMCVLLISYVENAPKSKE